MSHKGPSYPIPRDESERLQTLQDLNILDTGPEEGFDRLTTLAKDVFDCAITLVSLIDDDRQWFKSSTGLDACQTSREVAFCNYTILNDDIFEVPDAVADMRFKDNALVTGDPHIRYYAGAPIFVEGRRIATFCVIDTVARAPMDERQRRMLFSFAEMAAREIESRTLIRQSLAVISQNLASN